MNAPISVDSGITLFIYGGFLLAIGILHLILASAVAADAARQRARHVPLFLIGPGVWWLATLLGGIMTFGVYWLIHHSRLRPNRPPAAVKHEAEVHS
jgi:hypothetical protein